MLKQPIELMFGAYRRELLAALLMRPDEKYHLRELARMTGVPAGSIHRELRTMAESGLLTRERLGNQVFYQADQACPIYPELAAIFRKTIGLADLLRDAVRILDDRIKQALVFGSMASGLQNVSSDIDVLVLGDLELIEVVKALVPVQSSLRREINPVVMTTEEFFTRLNQQDRFAKRVFDEPRIFVIGSEHEFAKLAENRTAN